MRKRSLLILDYHLFEAANRIRTGTRLDVSILVEQIGTQQGSMGFLKQQACFPAVRHMRVWSKRNRYFPVQSCSPSASAWFGWGAPLESLLAYLMILFPPLPRSRNCAAGCSDQRQPRYTVGRMF